MSEKIQTQEKIEKKEEQKEQKKGRRKRGASPFGVEQKCRAVLELWTGTHRPSEICRQYAIPWSLLNHWEKRALEGMAQALTARACLTKSPAGLNPRLQNMLEKRLKRLQKACLGLSPVQSSSQNSLEKMSS